MSNMKKAREENKLHLCFRGFIWLGTPYSHQDGQYMAFHLLNFSQLEVLAKHHINFASKLQDYKRQPRCLAIFPALQLRRNDAAIPAEPEIPWGSPIQVLSRC
jgi:hypothetical protein